MRYTICAIIKNETLYLDEWIQHHLSIGFTDIHLYEDYGSEPHSGITSNYPNVYLHSFAETNYTSGHKQMVLFEYFINNYKHQYDWCAFIDADEFIRFADGYNLEKLCNEFKDNTGVKLCWKVFNSNGHITRPQGKLQDVYTNDIDFLGKYLNLAHLNMKSIVNFNSPSLTFSCHHEIMDGVYTNHQPNIQREPLYDKAWIDHYYTKSYQDWLERFVKRGGGITTVRKKRHFFECNSFTPEQLLECRELYNKLTGNNTTENNKKRLLIVGNKPINNDITDIVNSYDLVLRYNKLDNSDKTGLRCDIYFPLFQSSETIPHLTLNAIKKSSKFITCSDALDNEKNHYKELLGSSYLDNNVTYSRNDLIREYNLEISSQIFHRYKPLCNVILYAVMHYLDEHTIDVTAFDLDRKYFKDDIWSCYYNAEYCIFADLIVDGKINYLDTENLGKK